MRGPRQRRPLPGGKTARNERRKLRATSFNAIALAFLAVGAIQPLMMGTLSRSTWIRVALAWLVFYTLHDVAIRLLRDLED